MSDTRQEEVRSGRVRIKVVGVGGAGSNAVTRLAGNGLRGIEVTCVNTDVQALETVQNAARLAIGWRATGGFGAGGDPEMGRRAAEEDRSRIEETVADADLVFVTAGMGGGTGSGAAPIVASLARKTGALTVAVISRPFAFEGQARTRHGEDAVSAMAECVDTLLVVDNDRLLRTLEATVSLDAAFAAADDVLGRGVRAITDTVVTAGMINVDFADVRTVMRNAGRAHMSVGEGSGENAATDAARKALESPLLGLKVGSATRALVNVAGGEGLTLAAVHESVDAIRRAIHREANIIVGVVTDERLGDSVRVTLIATGLDPSTPRSTRRRRGSRATRMPETGPALDVQVEESEQLALAGTAGRTAGSANGSRSTVLVEE